MSEVTTPPSPAILSSGRLLKTAEVMKLFGYDDTTTFWQAVRRAGIPFVRVSSRKAIFREEAIEAWMKARTKGGATK